MQIHNTLFHFLFFFFIAFLSRRFGATIVCALYVNDSSSECMECCLAPGSSGAPPAYFAISSATIEPEPVPTDVDAHLALLAEAVGRETI